MIILGLGSNLGDRLTNLRKAYQAIKHLSGVKITAVSPLYLSDALLPDNAPEDWNKPYINLCISCEVKLSPHQLLAQLKKIEDAMGRDQSLAWGPRTIDIDILAFEQEIIHSENLYVPHPQLLERPFAAWPFADLAPFWVYPLSGPHQGKPLAEIVAAWGSRFSGHAAYGTKQIAQRIDAPQLMGIINITPDSFSDGGKFSSVEQALAQAQKLVIEGADVIDIGAESTAPSSRPLTAEEEWLRLKPCLEMITHEKKNFLIPPKISVDTYHAATAEKAMAYAIDLINDVTGLTSKAMQDFAAHARIDFVMMHHVAIPSQNKTKLAYAQNPFASAKRFLIQQIEILTAKGISPEQLIFDPGIGYGLHAEQSLQLLKNINDFESFGLRVLVGHSRKSFFSLFTDKPHAERDIETTSSALALINRGIDYFRIHDVGACARAFKIFKTFETV